MVRYIYDAWGNHAVLDANGNDIDDPDHIGNLNPFRYRGYYYDVETGLYFLQTRYYDPEVGRFISQDGVEYADPTTVNGLNLYAYCGNNPVMNVDPTGHSLLAFLLILGGILVGGVVNGLIAGANAAEGESFGSAFLGGFISGVISGIGLAAGLAIAASGGIGLFLLGGAVATISGFVGGFVDNIVSQSLSYGDVDYKVAAIAGGIGAATNLVAYVGLSVSGMYSTSDMFMARFAGNLVLDIIPLAMAVFIGTLPFINPNNLRGKLNSYYEKKIFR